MSDNEALQHVLGRLKNPPHLRCEWTMLMTASLMSKKLDEGCLPQCRNNEPLLSVLEEIWEYAERQIVSSNTLTHPPAGYPSRTALIWHHSSIKLVCVHEAAHTQWCETDFFIIIIFNYKIWTRVNTFRNKMRFVTLKHRLHDATLWPLLLYVEAHF